ncbi:MAG: efflux transporter periplasmic adaptor subunit, partial [Chloroflexi bacterium]|nr:efflux transporter periplasmic adaptor subunit [Chloroflexota bacterium]
VEILEGVQAGDTVLIGAETEGVPFSATQQTQNAAPGGFGGGAGGFGGGGGGAGFGGGGGGR